MPFYILKKVIHYRPLADAIFQAPYLVSVIFNFQDSEHGREKIGRRESYASVTEGKLLSEKYRGIKLRFVEHKDTTAEDIVKGLKSRCNVVDVETVQPMPGRGNWIVVFSREEIAENCLGGIIINGEELIPKRVAKSRFVHASVSFIPPDVSHEEQVDALEEFATVIDIKHQYMRD